MLHRTIFRVRFDLVGDDASKNIPFEHYDAFGVTPLHIQRSKDDHLRAIYLLGEGISELREKKDEMCLVATKFRIMATGERMHAKL